MKITWDDSLLTGDSELDTHHKAFFSKARRIVVACDLGRGAQEIESTIRFLVSYAEHHFAREEARMVEVGYPYAQTHCEQHASFLQQVAALQRAISAGGDREQAARQLASFAADWFMGHIRTADQPLVRYLRDLRQD